MKTFPAILVALLIMLAACTQTSNESRNSEARRLFFQSVKLVKQYSDSIKAANDSATIHRLDSTYLARLTELNLSLPPELDIQLTEGENDTLFKLTKTYVELRSRRLRKATPPALSDSTIAKSGME